MKETRTRFDAMSYHEIIRQQQLREQEERIILMGFGNKPRLDLMTKEDFEEGRALFRQTTNDNFILFSLDLHYQEHGLKPCRSSFCMHSACKRLI